MWHPLYPNYYLSRRTWRKGGLLLGTSLHIHLLRCTMCHMSITFVLHRTLSVTTSSSPSPFSSIYMARSSCQLRSVVGAANIMLIT